MFEANTSWVTGQKVTASDQNRIEAGVLAASGGAAGSAFIETFSGANDTAKLSAAMSYAGAQTNPPWITLDARQYTFTSSIGKPYDGFRLAGPNRGWTTYNNSPCRVNLNLGSSTWINLTSSHEYMSMRDIYFLNTDNSTQWMGGSGTLRHASLHNLGFGGFNGVLGNTNTKLLMLECAFTGTWAVAGYYHTPIHIGGSDCMALWPEGMDLNSTATPTAANSWALICDTLGKSSIGPVYLTADGTSSTTGWRGVWVFGKSEGLAFNGTIIEGFGSSRPSPGSLMRIQGGSVSLHGVKIGDGMANPASTASANGTSTADRSLIEVVPASGDNSGDLVQLGMFGTHVYHAGGVSISTPIVYADGTSRVSAYGTMAHKSYDADATWGTSLPVIKHASTASVIADSTVTVTEV